MKNYFSGFLYTFSVLFFGCSFLLSAQQFPASIGFKARIATYDYSRYNRMVNSSEFMLKPDGGTVNQKYFDTEWTVTSRILQVPDRSGAVDVEVQFKLNKGNSAQTGVAVQLEFKDWSQENYVLMPGAVYNGNRFVSRRIGYSPKLLDPKDIGIDKPMVVSDIPGLNIAEGPSRIQERIGSMTVPGVGFHSPGTGKGMWMLTDQKTSLGDYGLDLEETRGRKTAIITLSAPVLRETYKYRITDNRFPSDDRAPDWKSGDAVTLKFRVYLFESPDIQSLYDKLFAIRNDVVPAPVLPNVLPFSDAYTVEEEKFNTLNWTPNPGYYAVGDKSMFLQDWQIGWTGGMISTYPLLWEGKPKTKANVISNFDWLFANGISPSGFFWDSGEEGTKWYGGDIRKPHTKNWHLVRKSGDGLYFIIKQFYLMQKMQLPVKEEWKTGTRGCADAFVKLWNTYGQLGQFVNNETGVIEVGGSTSGAIVPAALVLAGRYYNDSTYLTKALEIAEYFYTDYVQKGITSGGPGDALQNPDSESAYAMLESFMMLYEATGDSKWLTRSEEMARQFASWVMPYDYEFPATSLFGRLGLHSAGAVFANTQNKHGAPGICTHSGDALWRLYRATGDVRYMNLLKEMAHNITQFQAHPLKPIEDLPYGWMSERVSTTDWLEGIGEIVRHTTWAETALMLTYIEVPGIYIIPDKSEVHVIDHVEVVKKRDTSKMLSLSVTNPTKMLAKVKVYVESSRESKNTLNLQPLMNATELTIPAGKTVNMSFKK